jgi:hypothetical protein
MPDVLFMVVISKVTLTLTAKDLYKWKSAQSVKTIDVLKFSLISSNKQRLLT